MTPFIFGSYEQLNEFKTNIEDYNLSEIQLNQIKDKVESRDLSFSDKLKSDKQSLGLMTLRMATLHLDSRIYEMNNHF